MKHVEEHLLELFVLDPRGLGTGRTEVEAHLSHCVGCRVLVEEMSRFYEAADEEFRASHLPARNVQNSLVHRHAKSELFRPVTSPMVRSRLSRRLRLRDVVFRHPVATGTGAFMGLALLAFAVFFIVGSPEDTNPAYVHLNPGRDQLEVFNRGNKLLWHLPSIRLEQVANQQEINLVPQSQVTDLDGDGKNEVVTCIRMAFDPEHMQPPVRIVNSLGVVLHERRLGDHVSFAGRQYDSHYSAHGVLVRQIVESGKKEILVLANNYRSPSLITRLTSTGEVLGEYWHYGALYGIYMVEVGGRSLLLACGTNDTPDTTGDSGKSNAVIVQLDPERVVGRSESAFTRGFGFPASNAELVYIYLPRSDMNETLNLPLASTRMRQDRPELLDFVAASGPSDGVPIFHFLLTNELMPVSVLSDERTQQLHAKLVKEGRITSVWDTAYLDEMKGRIVVTRGVSPVLPLPW